MKSELRMQVNTTAVVQLGSQLMRDRPSLGFKPAMHEALQAYIMIHEVFPHEITRMDELWTLALALHARNPAVPFVAHYSDAVELRCNELPDVLAYGVHRPPKEGGGWFRCRQAADGGRSVIMVELVTPDAEDGAA